MAPFSRNFTADDDSSFLKKFLLSYHPRSTFGSILVYGLLASSILFFGIGSVWYSYIYHAVEPSKVLVWFLSTFAMLAFCWLLASNVATARKAKSMVGSGVAFWVQLILMGSVGFFAFFSFVFGVLVNPRDDEFFSESDASQFDGAMLHLNRFYGVRLAENQALKHHFMLALFPDPIWLYFIDGARRDLSISNAEGFSYTPVEKDDKYLFHDVCEPRYSVTDSAPLIRKFCKDETAIIEAVTYLEPAVTPESPREYLHIFRVNDGELYIVERHDL